MNEVQTQIYDVFVEFDRVCKILNLDYSLSYGTLLGAIRHDGFIPWDDDIDVNMERSQYEIFMAEAPKHFKDNYFLQNNESDPYYYFPFAKVRNNEIELREKATAHLPINHGVWIDIFPYDKIPNDVEKQKQLFEEVQKYSNKINFFNFMYVSGYERKPIQIIKKIVVFFNKKFYKINFLTRKWVRNREQLMKSMNQDENLDTYALTGFRHKSFDAYLASKIYKDEINDLSVHKFEESLYPIYKNYDEILTRIYGDYMTPPPIEEQKSVHTFEN